MTSILSLILQIFFMQFVAVDSIQAVPTVTPQATVTPTSYVSSNAVIRSINEVRGSHGLKPLKDNKCLYSSAEEKNSHMLSKHYWEHVSPGGVQYSHFIFKNCPSFNYAGENLAIQYKSSDVVNAWMQSPTHRAILLGEYAYAGIKAIQLPSGYAITLHVGQ